MKILLAIYFFSVVSQATSANGNIVFTIQDINNIADSGRATEIECDAVRLCEITLNKFKLLSQSSKLDSSLKFLTNKDNIPTANSQSFTPSKLVIANGVKFKIGTLVDYKGLELEKFKSYSDRLSKLDLYLQSKVAMEKSRLKR